MRLYRTIENDAAVAQNYQKLAGRTFDIYDLTVPSNTDEFVESILAPIRDPMMKLFPDLQLNGLANPLKDGTFRFNKGSSEKFHFKNLSGGEKAAFDLILDLVIALETYNDTLFCIDEPEAHMNTRVQAELLSVIHDLIPTNCQLMLATHSIGMMRRAWDIATEHPDDVVFLDFSDCDLDQATVIRPTRPDRKSWNKVYEIALDDLASLVAPERVVICEGEPKKKISMTNHAHDARCYENIFKGKYPKVQFVPGGNAAEVAGDSRGVAYVLSVLARGIEVTKLIDRDANSSEEIEELQSQGTRVLSRRNLESYLFDDEVLREVARSVDQEEKAESLIAKKTELLEAQLKGAADDLKPVSGLIYVECKNLLQLSNPGNNVKTFMRDTLAPLVHPEMSVYRVLETDIFGLEEKTSCQATEEPHSSTRKTNGSRGI